MVFFVSVLEKAGKRSLGQKGKGQVKEGRFLRGQRLGGECGLGQLAIKGHGVSSRCRRVSSVLREVGGEEVSIVEVTWSALKEHEVSRSGQRVRNEGEVVSVKFQVSQAI